MTRCSVSRIKAVRTGTTALEDGQDQPRRHPLLASVWGPTSSCSPLVGMQNGPAVGRPGAQSEERAALDLGVMSQSPMLSIEMT